MDLEIYYFSKIVTLKLGIYSKNKLGISEVKEKYFYVFFLLKAYIRKYGFPVDLIFAVASINENYNFLSLKTLKIGFYMIVSLMLSFFVSSIQINVVLLTVIINAINRFLEILN